MEISGEYRHCAVSFGRSVAQSDQLGPEVGSCLALMLYLLHEPDVL